MSGFQLISTILLSSLLLTFIVIFTKKYLRNKNKKNQIGLVKIKDFDEDAYINSAFEDVFKSIKFDSWEVKMSYGDREISFTKKSSSDSFTKLILIFKFSFKDDIFEMERIKLETNSKIFYFKGKLKKDTLQYFYEIYSKNQIESNNLAKSKIDKELESINLIIGKASKRDSKIDEILG